MKIPIEVEPFSSYNCFHSALGTTTVTFLKENVTKALHLNWQFFYSTRKDYCHDFRFIGEYPDPYDRTLTDRLYKLHGIHFTEKNITLDSTNSDIIQDIKENGYSLINANNYYYESEDLTNNEHSITTIVVYDYDPQENKFLYFKPNQYGVENEEKCGWISNEFLFESRKDIQGGRKIGGTKFDIKLLNDKKYDIDESYMINILLDNINEFLVGAKDIDNIYGIEGIKLFAEDIKDWGKESEKEKLFCRILDTSKYLVFVKRQRILFIENLKNYCGETQQGNIRCFLNEENDKIEELLKCWGDLRLVLTLFAYRKQIGNLQKISEQIDKIGIQEKELMERLMYKLKY